MARRKNKLGMFTAISYLKLLAVLLMIFLNYQQISKQLKYRELARSTQNWIESEARLMSTVFQTSGSAYILFEYSFQDSSYQSSQTTIDQGASLSPVEKSTLKNDYSEQTKVPVYINPEKPAESVLFRVDPPALTPSENLFSFIILIYFLLVFLLEPLLLRLIKAKNDRKVDENKDLAHI